MPKIYLTQRPADGAAEVRGATNPLDSLERLAAAIATSVPHSFELADWVVAAGLRRA